MKTFKQIIQENVIKKAKELAWKKLSAKEQQSFLDQAQQISDEETKELAKKCWEEAGKVFENPNFISRANGNIYLTKKGKK